MDKDFYIEIYEWTHLPTKDKWVTIYKQKNNFKKSLKGSFVQCIFKKRFNSLIAAKDYMKINYKDYSLMEEDEYHCHYSK